jgi:hypothetical protein
MPPKVDAASLLGDAMESLAAQRGIFHSKADFQHALAWQVQTTHPNASLRLEKRVTVAPIWAPSSSRRPVLYDAFRIHHGHTLAGTMAWGDWGTQGGRPPGGTGSITLTGTYPLDWHDYSVVDGVPFRYLLVGIDRAGIDLARRNTNPLQDGGDEALQPRAENAEGRIRLIGPEIEVIEAEGSRRLVFPRDAAYSEFCEGLAEGERRWDPSWGFHPDDDPDSYPPGAIF